MRTFVLLRFIHSIFKGKIFWKKDEKSEEKSRTKKKTNFDPNFYKNEKTEINQSITLNFKTLQQNNQRVYDVKNLFFFSSKKKKFFVIIFQIASNVYKSIPKQINTEKHESKKKKNLKVYRKKNQQNNGNRKYIRINIILLVF